MIQTRQISQPFFFKNIQNVISTTECYQVQTHNFKCCVNNTDGNFDYS